MPVEFVRVKIPETGAEWDAPVTALKAHQGLIRLDKPAARPPTSKPRRPLGEGPTRRAAARTESAEPAGQAPSDDDSTETSSAAAAAEQKE